MHFIFLHVSMCACQLYPMIELPLETCSPTFTLTHKLKTAFGQPLSLLVVLPALSPSPWNRLNLAANAGNDDDDVCPLHLLYILFAHTSQTEKKVKHTLIVRVLAAC